MVQRDEIFSCKYWQAIVRAGLTPLSGYGLYFQGAATPLYLLVS
jgi:hypothetical protein